MKNVLQSCSTVMELSLNYCCYIDFACKNETLDTSSEDKPFNKLDEIIDNRTHQNYFTKDQDVGKSKSQESIEKGNQLTHSVSLNCDESESKCKFSKQVQTRFLKWEGKSFPNKIIAFTNIIKGAHPVAGHTNIKFKPVPHLKWA